MALNSFISLLPPLGIAGLHDHTLLLPSFFFLWSYYDFFQGEAKARIQRLQPGYQLFWFPSGTWGAFGLLGQDSTFSPGERVWKCSCDDRSHRKCSIGTVTFTERAPWHYFGGVDTEGTGSQGEGLKTGRFGVSVKSAPRAQLSMQPLHTAVCGTVLPELAPPDPALQRMPNRPEAWIQLTI